MLHEIAGYGYCHNLLPRSTLGSLSLEIDMTRQELEMIERIAAVMTEAGQECSVE